jgi:hypothetical protein
MNETMNALCGTDPFCGWSGTIQRFVETDQLTWLQSLQAHRTD